MHVTQVHRSQRNKPDEKQDARTETIFTKTITEDPQLARQPEGHGKLFICGSLYHYFLIFIFVPRPHLAIFNVYYWLFAQGLFLVVLRALDMVPRIYTGVSHVQGKNIYVSLSPNPIISLWPQTLSF